jgi:predicted ester cyclase
LSAERWSCAGGRVANDDNNLENPMDRSQAEQLARRWAHEGVAQGRVAIFDELVSADAIDHSGPNEVLGAESFKSRTRALHAAFTEIEVVVNDLVVDGSKIAWRWTLTGTHYGPFLGAPPTGKRVTMTGMNIQRVANRVVVEHWTNADQLGLLRQVQAP